MPFGFSRESAFGFAGILTKLDRRNELALRAG
jgi:hypothetical protein